MQIVIGLAITVFLVVTAAFARGLVGREDLSKRIAQNESFTHAGKLVFPIGAGMIGTFLAATDAASGIRTQSSSSPHATACLL